jgi:hypothetical protein
MPFSILLVLSTVLYHFIDSLDLMIVEEVIQAIGDEIRLGNEDGGH